ncbi:DUF3958 family protein [Enterococcus sp. BWR-S5]|nr:DUF3958 family protein [Enterococcus sp. BWR-S5]
MMTAEQDKKKKERILLEKQEDLQLSKRQLEKVQEDYQEQFYSSNRLFHELKESFHGNDFALLFEDIHEDLQKEQRVIIEDLDEEREELTEQQVACQDELDELYYEKKREAADGEEES